MKKNRWLIIGTIALITLIAAAVFAYGMSRPEGSAGHKDISVTIVTGEGSEPLALHTHAEFLRGALEENGLIEGEEGPYGLYVTAVNGIVADESQEQWWGFTKGGEMLNTGVDDTPISDGDAFEITLHTGWEG